MLYTYEMLLDGRKFFENCDSLSLLALRFSLPSFICGGKKQEIGRKELRLVGTCLSFASIPDLPLVFSMYLPFYF